MIIPGNSLVTQKPLNTKPLDEIYDDMQVGGEYVPSRDESRTGETSKTNFSDYNGDWRSYLQDLVDRGDAEAADKLINYLMSEDSAQKQRDWESTSYQRLVNDLKAAGINPYILLNSGASPISSSNSNSYSGSQFTTRAANKETARHNQQTEGLNFLKTLLMMIPFFVAMAV